MFATVLDRIDLAGAVIPADALCRRRHKASYADLFVMPMRVRKPLVGAGSTCGWLA
jgi:hypothetical protein